MGYSVSDSKVNFEHQLTRAGVKDGQWVRQNERPQDSRFHEFANRFEAAVQADKEIDAGKRNPWGILGDKYDKEVQRRFFRHLSLRKMTTDEAAKEAVAEVDSMVTRVGDDMVAVHGEETRFGKASD